VSEFKKIMLTIFAESALESQICNDVEKLGASGYTVTNARGKGESGNRKGSWDHDGNIRIEVVCDKETAHKIQESLQENYYKNFAIMICAHEVDVLRVGKFS